MTTSILDDIITFFGSFILLTILMLVIAYMLEYQFGTNTWYFITGLNVPPIHYIIFGRDPL